MSAEKDECCFPGCTTPPSKRDDGTLACPAHLHVHVSEYGSWVGCERAEAS